MINVLKLKKYLVEQKILTRTGKELAKGSLYHILSNKVYLGKIVHKNKEYDGLHEPIISEELFNDVQNLLKANSVERKHATNAKNGSLLTGLLYDDIGNKMSPSASNANNKNYRYYVSMAIKNPVDYERGEITKISAREIEKFVQDDLVKLLQNTHRIQSYLENYPVEQQKIILEQMQKFEPDKVFLRTANNKRLRKLRFLPPEIIESIMNGIQDPELNVKKLIEMAEKSVL